MPRIRFALGALFCAVFCAQAQSQTTTILLDEVRTIATADTGAPLEFSFDIGTPGRYQLTLSDLGAALATPAPLASLKLAITRGGTLVGEPLTGEGTLQFDGAVGTYVARVIGKPGSGLGSGPIGVKINAASGTLLYSFSDSLSLPSQQLPNSVRTLDEQFTVPASGNYDITLTDLELPTVLDLLTLILVPDADPSAVPVTLTVAPGSTQASASSAPLQAGVTYRVFAVGEASSAGKAGLFSVVVRPSGGASPVAFSRTLAVGLTQSLGVTTVGSTDYTFNLLDLAFPAPLSQAGAALVLDGAIVKRLTATGSTNFTATSATYQVFAVGIPGVATATLPDAGSYTVAVRPVAGGAATFDFAEAVVAPGSAYSSYTYTAPASTAGGYRVRLTDFRIPKPLDSLSVAAVQGGAVLGAPLTAAGNLDVTAAAGSFSILVFARGAAEGGLFGLDATPTGQTTPVLDTTQGVGAVFTTRKLSVPAAGRYEVTAKDVQFPAALKAFTVVVTRGAERTGFALGSAALRFTATPGNYFINFIAELADPDKAGTYGMTVATAPPLPVVTLTASPTSVASGRTTALTWTTQNATSCTASGGGWTGTKAIAGGTESSPAITAATTFTLECTGTGGTTSATASVGLDAPATGGGGGGGGSFDPAALLALALLVVARFRRALGLGSAGRVEWRAVIRRAVAVAAAVACVSVASAATTPLPAEPEAATKIRATLAERFPQLKIDRVEPAPVPGLYAVVTPADIIYSDATGERLVMGHVMETRTREDLSTQRWNQLNAVDFESLPFASAIKTVKGSGKRKLAVFADPLCPYCRDLEAQLEGVNDVTVYTFLYPLESVHPGASEASARIWCSKDASAVWAAWMVKEVQPPTETCDKTPVKDVQALGAKLRVSSTPTLFLADGRRVSGSQTRAELETLLGSPN